VPLLVNIVSQIPTDIWSREQPNGLGMDFVHTHEPVVADIHVIYGLRTSLRVPNSRHNTFFVASEPPEIRRYNLKVLANYGAVIAPRFGYLVSLPNFVEATALAPWWAGARAGGTTHYSSTRQEVTLTREDFQRGFLPNENRMSVIVSPKARTPLQIQRLKLVDFLGNHVPSLDIYGPEYRPLADKAEALRRSRYHLSVENSIHPGYWTEKLSDPILLDNIVFYGGDSTATSYFQSGSVVMINPFDFDGTYRQVAEALESDLWGRNAKSRKENRQKVLGELSFHRILSRILTEREFIPSKDSHFSIPAQHPGRTIKSVFDPIYRLFT